MATTRFVFLPEAAAFPSSAFPQLSQDGQNRYYLAFDAAVDETAFWTFFAPQGLTGTMTLIVTYRAASATSGTFLPVAAIEAITDGDTVDTDAASSFDTDNTPSAATVPGTAGHIDQVSITLTNQDSIAAADYARLRLFRDISGDSATGDIEVLGVELRDAA